MFKVNNKVKNLNLVSYLFKKIWNELSSRRKLQLFSLLFLMLLSGIAEMLTLASVIPFITLLTNPESFLELNIVQKFSNFFGIKDYSDLLLSTTIFFISAVIFSALIRLTNLWLNIRLSALIGNDFSCKVFDRVLKKDYLFHINTPSSKSITIITSKIGALVLVISKYLQGLTSIIIITFILVSLIFIDKSIALTTFTIFGIIYLTIAYSLKNKLINISKTISLSSEIMVKTIQEGLSSIREIILDGNQKKYLSIFKSADFPVRIGYAKNTFFALFPRYVLETIGIIIISLIAYNLTTSSSQQLTSITFLGTLALGIQKILPAIQLAYTAWSEINGYSRSCIDIFDIINDENNEYKNIGFVEKLTTFKKLEFKNVSFRYSNDSKYILEDISFTIHSGEKVGIIGITGSGKSTLIDLIMGLLMPTKGEIFINDRKIDNDQNLALLYSWRRAIAHVPQNIFLSNGTIEENISFGYEEYNPNIEDIKFAADISCISEFINKLPLKYKSFVGERGVKISGGQIQRIGIARAVFKNKNILILDEATSSLDEKTEKDVIKNIENNGISNTLLMISHRPSTIKNCNRVFEVKDHTVIEIRSDS